MPLQFGLLTGKFDKGTRFAINDHRHFRLTPEILSTSLEALEEAWPLCGKYGISKTALSMSFVLSFPEVSTVIPGIKTPHQAESNTQGIVQLDAEDRDFIASLFESHFRKALRQMQQQG
jgi:aryl-alcohol dehydrogenase-like predicted oxidoreductase